MSRRVTHWSSWTGWCRPASLPNFRGMRIYAYREIVDALYTRPFKIEVRPRDERRGYCRSLGLSKGTVGNYLMRFNQAGLSWPLPCELDG